VTKTDDELREIIAEFNRKALLDELKPHEVAEIRELLPKIREMLERQRRMSWLFKSIGMIAIGAPAALFAIMQIWSKFIEWIKGQ
jgi:hypothetical protein